MTSKYNYDYNNTEFNQTIDLFSQLSISSSSSTSLPSSSSTEEKKNNTQEREANTSQMLSLVGKTICTQPVNLYTEEQNALLKGLPQDLAETIVFTNKKLCDTIYYTSVHRVLSGFPTDVVWNILGGSSSAPDKAFYWMYESKAEDTLANMLHRQANQALNSVNGLTRLLPEIPRRALMHPLFTDQLHAFSLTADEILKDENSLTCFLRLQDLTITRLTEQDTSSSQVLFQRIADLQTIQTLSLHSFAPHAINNIEKINTLQTLVLSPRNRVALGYNLPSSFSQLQNLHHLELDHYLFGSGNARSSMNSVKAIPNLRSITLTKCTGPIPLAYLFQNHPTLEKICLVEQTISKDCLEALKTCPHLKQVVLVNCHFECASSLISRDHMSLLQKEIPKAKVLVTETEALWEAKTIKELMATTK